MKARNLKLLILVLVVALLLIGCGGQNQSGNKPSEGNKLQTSEEGSEANSSSVGTVPGNKDSNVELKATDTWEVEGLWKLSNFKAEKIQAVDNEGNFVKVSFTMENLGHDADSEYNALQVEKVIDEKGEEASDASIKVDMSNVNVVTNVPVGSTVENIESVFELNNESKTIKIVFDQYSDDMIKHIATVECDVE